MTLRNLSFFVSAMTKGDGATFLSDLLITILLRMNRSVSIVNGSFESEFNVFSAGIPEMERFYGSGVSNLPRFSPPGRSMSEMGYDWRNFYPVPPVMPTSDVVVDLNGRGTELFFNAIDNNLFANVHSTMVIFHIVSARPDSLETFQAFHRQVINPEDPTTEWIMKISSLRRKARMREILCVNHAFGVIPDEVFSEWKGLLIHLPTIGSVRETGFSQLREAHLSISDIAEFTPDLIRSLSALPPDRISDFEILSARESTLRAVYEITMALRDIGVFNENPFSNVAFLSDIGFDPVLAENQARDSTS